MASDKISYRKQCFSLQYTLANSNFDKCKLKFFSGVFVRIKIQLSAFRHWVMGEKIILFSFSFCFSFKFIVSLASLSTFLLLSTLSKFICFLSSLLLFPFSQCFLFSFFPFHPFFFLFLCLYFLVLFGKIYGEKIANFFVT